VINVLTIEYPLERSVPRASVTYNVQYGNHGMVIGKSVVIISFINSSLKQSI
jgi:hypothetical protein